MTDYSIRQMTPADGRALLELALSSPDTGLTQIAPRYHLDAYQAMKELRLGIGWHIRIEGTPALRNVISKDGDANESNKHCAG